MHLTRNFEDDYILVLNKPAKMVVNRSETAKDNTLQDWLDAEIPLKDSSPKGDKESGGDADTEEDIESYRDPNEIISTYDDFISRNGIVHRLDKETSGVLIVAKDYDSFLNLQKQFSDRKIEKRYKAIVIGTVSEVDKGEVFEVDAPIKRNPRNWEKFAIVATGRPSFTSFKVIDFFSSDKGDFTLLECYPKTGRTHQIRVHLTAMGYPIAGDALYSGKKRYKKYSKLFPRQMLHASDIEFAHPKTGEKISVHADIPSDMLGVLDLIQSTIQH